MYSHISDINSLTISNDQAMWFHALPSINDFSENEIIKIYANITKHFTPKKELQYAMTLLKLSGMKNLGSENKKVITAFLQDLFA